MAAQEDVRIHPEQVSPAESHVHGFKLFLSASGMGGVVSVRTKSWEEL